MKNQSKIIVIKQYIAKIIKSKLDINHLFLHDGIIIQLINERKNEPTLFIPMLIIIIIIEKW